MTFASIAATATAQFGPPTSVNLGIGASPNVITSVAAGDLDGDGVEDLVGVDNVANGSVGAALGIGGGAYGAPVLSPGTGTSAGAFLAAVGDFNLDGTLDLVYSGGDASVGGNPESIFVVAGDPANPGRFLMAAPFIRAVAPGGVVTEICTTDFDLDGEQDVLAALGPARRVSLMPGLPGITFGPVVSIQTTGDASDIDVCVDFNQDGRKDFVVCSEPTSTSPGLIEVFQGRNPALFPTPIDPQPAASIAMPQNGIPVAAHWIDCDQNKLYDLMVSLTGPNPRILLLRNLGTPGGFFSAASITSPMLLNNMPATPMRLEVDFDGVEDLSLFTFNPVSPTVAASNFNVYGVLDCALSVGPVTSVGTFDTAGLNAKSSRLLDVDDQNGDGKEDVAVISHTGLQGRVLVYPNIGQTNYTISPPKPLLAQTVQFTFRFQAPAALGGRPFAVLFSPNGTVPGINLSAGLNLPLNPPFFGFTVTGTLPANGQLQFQTPPVAIPPSPKGFSLQIASTVVVAGTGPTQGTIVFASNPSVVTIP